MKVLSVRQPWAHALLALGKDVENRSWPTSYRGTVAIHASTHVDRAAEHWERAGELLGDIDVSALPRGVILGVVDLRDCTRHVASPWAFPGVWHWSVTDPHSLLDPIPWRGRLNLTDLPDTVSHRITSELARTA